MEHPVLVQEDDRGIIRFTFNGEEVKAREGEMIATALFANGTHVFGHHHRDGGAQGIFCANGQCAQCLVLADGVPVKSCVVPAESGMDVRSMEGLPELLADDAVMDIGGSVPFVSTQVLIVGGGPAGLTAAIELGTKGVECIICDDKHELGGKLGLQTHNFFGSVRDCFAGTRGMDIGTDLAAAVTGLPTVDVWLNSPVVGVFAENVAGVVRDGRYVLVRPERLLITAGAREKVLDFPGCDLPGVYGGGAFQTLVNRDRVRAAERLFIVGGGNVGLIAAYHALQAGIDVVGLVEALPHCGGYKVHLDKILRLGVPVYTSHTVLRAEPMGDEDVKVIFDVNNDASGSGGDEGGDELARIVITQIDDRFQPIEGTEREFEVDTLLIAVGLSPVDELTKAAQSSGIQMSSAGDAKRLPVYAAGDADEIAEASAAMFSGRIAGREILADMGHDVEVPPEWNEMLEILRSKAGDDEGFRAPPKGLEVYPVIRCPQEIPCDPCTEACVKQSIMIREATMKGRPLFEGGCLGCTNCVAVCPGLAITLVDKRYDPSGENALVVIPWELPEGTIVPGQEVVTSGPEGEVIGRGKVIALKGSDWQDRRSLMSIEVPSIEANKVAGIRIREPKDGRPIGQVHAHEDDEIVVCRCERVTRAEIVEYIERTGVTDFNAIKAGLRVGMGPCGGKTCNASVERLLRGITGEADIEPHVERPFAQEVPLSAFLDQGGDER